MSADETPLQVGDRIRLTEEAGVPDGIVRYACADRLLRVQRTEGNEPGYILVSGTRYGDQWLPASDFELVKRQEPTEGERIQRARDVLAKWRKAAREGEWSIESDTVESSWLGRGTAGNPDLLHAIDGLLATAVVQQFTGPVDHTYQTSASLIAAAIIAADERMGR